MGAFELLTSLGLGVLGEVLVYFVATRIFKLQGKAAALIVALLVVLFYVPWALIKWPGADVFAIHLAIFLTLAYGIGLISGRAGKGWHWAPATIVGFFVFVVVINIVFVTVAEQGISGIFAEILPKPRDSDVAVSRFPGVVSHDFQEKEALYNAYLREVEAQQARGWHVKTGWLGKARVGEQLPLVVRVRDRSDKPVSGATIAGSFLRPADVRDDFAFNMTEVSPGDYQVVMAMPKPGLWRMVLNIQRDDDKHEIRATTSVQPAID